MRARYSVYRTLKELRCVRCAAARLVLFQAPFQIIGDAGVQAGVGTLQDVDDPHAQCVMLNVQLNMKNCASTIHSWGGTVTEYHATPYRSPPPIFHAPFVGRVQTMMPCRADPAGISHQPPSESSAVG